MPRGGGAVAIVGADAMGKANDEEVRTLTTGMSASERGG